MATHFMKLNPEPFDKIKNRTKIYELRLYDEKRAKIRVGDFIEFTELVSGEKIRVKVVGLRRFGSFAELYSELPLDQCGYAADEIDGARSEDMEIYYSKEEQRKFGVVAIKIEVVA